MISLLIFALVVLIVCVVIGYIIRLLVTVQPWQNVALAARVAAVHAIHVDFAVA